MRAADVGGAELQRPVRFRGVGAKSGGKLADLEATEAGALPRPGQPSRDISTAMASGVTEVFIASSRGARACPARSRTAGNVRARLDGRSFTWVRNPRLRVRTSALVCMSPTRDACRKRMARRRAFF